jgi:hypothetical protein
LRGNTNHDPKNAGANHGSHRIDPSTVSIRMPAWPTEVARKPLGNRRVGELLTGTRDVLGPGRAVPVAQLETAGGSAYQPAGTAGAGA